MKRCCKNYAHDVYTRMYAIMDKPRRKLWLIFFALFLVWSISVYNLDLIPRFSIVSHTVESPVAADNGSESDSDVDEESSWKFASEESDLIPYQEGSSQFTSDVSDINKNNATTVSNSSSKEPRNPTVHQDTDNPSGGGDSLIGNAILDVESLEKELEADKRRNRKPCTGRYIYIHNIPTKFNEDYLKQCKKMNKWQDMCPYFKNAGLGQRLGNPARVFTSTGWYNTNQFSLEVIFHNIMKQYECLTEDPSKAAAIFVPYYPGLDVARYLRDGSNNSVKDNDAIELFKWLRERPEWEVMGGKDHFMVSGRITWDMRRATDEGNGWGSKLMLLPEARNMTVLTMESSPWDKNDFAIPYPTYFHPSGDEQVRGWQIRMRRRRRKTLFCFAGSPRPNMEGSIRGEVMQQCTGATRRRCRLIDCKDRRRNCHKPAYVMKMFQNSNFCLQPTGDSFTRRSTFDAIIAGCIPVFFSPGSAYVQYLWHLPKNFSSYSVLISEEDVRQKKVKIESVLSRIPKPKVAAMREEVIKLIPNVIYADPKLRLDHMDDAFDLAVKGVTKRVYELRKEMQEGRRDSDEFNPESSWKYYTFGTTQKHEWDHFFNRSM